MVLNGAAIGLIYADRFDDAPIVLDEHEMRLVRALRDQAVAGFTRPH